MGAISVGRVFCSFTGGRETGLGEMPGAGAISFAGGRGVGAGSTLGEGAISDAAAGVVSPLVSDDTETPVPEEDTALSLAPELAPIEALAAASSDAAANASGTAKSSDTNTVKRNNLFTITPPNTLIVFF